MEDRRQGPDKLVRLLILLTVAGWILLLLAAVTVFYAKPEMSTGFIRYRGIEIRETWVDALVPVAAMFFILATATSLAGAWLQRRRGKRQTDMPLFVHIMMLLLSGGGLLVIAFLTQ